MGDMAPDTVGDRIRQEREILGITQAQLGSLIGASRVTVARWENGTRKTPLAAILQISVSLGITVERLRAQSPAQQLLAA